MASRIREEAEPLVVDYVHHENIRAARCKLLCSNTTVLATSIITTGMGIAALLTKGVTREYVVITHVVLSGILTVFVVVSFVQTCRFVFKHMV